GVIVADLLRHGVARDVSFGSLFEDAAEDLLIALVELVEAAPTDWSAGIGLFFSQVPHAYW
ncbi:MAG: hypothetical protein JWP63_1956, partial [Candidatus Solibacter sp.]|nr:hypothetical protein [Candidatus Solibacter sp.]